MNPWSPESWKSYPALHQPAWPDKAKLARILEKLAERLPLVFSGEVDRLRGRLADAARGKAFLLQGGDCAERFAPTLEQVENKLKTLLQMNMVLMYAAAKPVIKVGRFAGQYAKPRSSPTEKVGDQVLPSYFGDIVNRPERTAEARELNPKNLLDAYNFSASTLNIVRGLSVGGFADLHRVHAFNEAFVAESPQGQHYAQIADGISSALAFMRACGVTEHEALETTDFFTSHEALLLEYEQGLTRRDPDSGWWYDLSAHMLWIGERTRQPEGAHVEFLRGVKNPLGVKLGPATAEDDLCRLARALNPANEPGRLTCITRFGADKIEEHLPRLLKVALREGFEILWSSDPMHGNTSSTPNGYKTRDFTAVLTELQRFFSIHQALGTVAGGVHLELTGDDVTECTGGADQLTAEALEQNYLTACDPRLNAKQALELSFLIAKEIA